MTFRRLIAFVGLASSAACTGTIGDNGSKPATVVLEAPQVRRLTALQYNNTVKAAFGDIFAPDDYPHFGDDNPTIGFANDANILKISDVNAQTLFDSTDAMAAKALNVSPALTPCVSATTDDCFASIINDIGGKLWRRPVTDEERTDLLAAQGQVAVSGTRTDRVQFLVQVMLASPNMLYRAELGAVRNGKADLDDYEIASALAFTFTNAPPDSELAGLAAQGALQDKDALRAQAERLSGGDAYIDALTEFYADYLKLDSLLTIRKLTALGLTDAVREDLLAGARADIRSSFTKSGATLLDPFTLTRFSMNTITAPFFNATSDSPALLEQNVDPAQRYGILTHPAFLAEQSGEGETSIVKRGVFSLQQLLCFPIGAAPADNVPDPSQVPPGFNPDMNSSRVVLDVQHTSAPACKGCHAIIDPAGAGYENFDAAGKFRVTEKAAKIPIDASGSLVVGDETLTYTAGIDYPKALAGSQALRVCMAEKLITYVLGSRPNNDEVSAFTAGFVSAEADIKEIAKLIVASPSFSARTPSED